jgi:hypothetical protein
MVSSWEDGLFVLDGGKTEHLFKGAQISCLAHDGAGGALAVLDSRSLWARPAGEAWRELGSSEASPHCCLSVGGRIIVGTDDARLLEQALDGWRPLTGFDATPGRSGWYAGAAVVDGKLLGPPLGIRSMASACDQRALLVNVHVGGVPRSVDGGVSWRPTIDIEADVHEVWTHPSRPEIAVAAAAAGLCVSRDGGASWTVSCEGLHAAHCSAVALTEHDLYISAADSPFAEEGAVYRRRIDEDGPPQLVGRGLPDRLDRGVDTRGIGARGETLAIVDRGGTLYASHNGGASWSLQARGFPAPSGVLIC